MHLSVIHPLFVTTYMAYSSGRVFELARKACFMHLSICSVSVTSLVTSLSRHIIKSMHSGIWGLFDGKVKEEKNRRPGRKKTWCFKGFNGHVLSKWRNEELAVKRGISEEQLCHVMAVQLLQTSLQHWLKNRQPALQDATEGALHRFIIHGDVSNVLTWTGAATS